jgi:hypothetical protein
MGLQYTLPFVQTSPLSQYWFVGSDSLDEQPYNLLQLRCKIQQAGGCCCCDDIEQGNALNP